MNIFDVLANLIVEFAQLANGTLCKWVNLTGDSSGPLDPSINLTSSGSCLIQDIATVAIMFSDLVVHVLSGLSAAPL